MKIKDVMFCDDIRREMNNKLSLMGLYNDKIVIKSNSSTPIPWPVQLPIATLVRLELDQNDQFDKFEFKYLNNETEVGKLAGTFTKKENQEYFNINVFANLKLNRGYLGFEIKVLNGDEVVFDDTRINAIKITEELSESGTSLFG